MITNDDAADLLARLDLGSTVAESDNLLETARVETSVFDDLLADRVDLIPGTKGSGKTALYRMFVDFLPQMMLKNKSRRPDPAWAPFPAWPVKYRSTSSLTTAPSGVSVLRDN
jgi:hypothetical protein